MTSVFQRLKDKAINHATKMSPEKLIPGKLYPAIEFRLRKSDYADKNGKFPNNLLAYFKVQEMKYYITCPTLYNETSEEDVQELNEAIKQGKAPNICFYGKDGPRNDILIHEHNEGVDSARLEEFNKKRKAAAEEKETEGKPSTSQTPPEKKPKTE